MKSPNQQAVNGRELQASEIAGMAMPEHFTPAQKERLAEVRHLSADECDELGEELMESARDVMKCAAWMREVQRTMERTATLARN